MAASLCSLWRRPILLTKSDDKTLMMDSVLLNNEATRNKKRKKNLHEHKSWETVRQNKIKVIDEI